MKKIIRHMSIIIFLAAVIIYLILGSYQYSYSYKNQELKEEISDLEKSQDDIYIQITEMNSRESILNEYPGLAIYDNIYYLQEEENE